MSAWRQLVSAALVGTSQAKAPPLPACLAGCLPASETANRESAFLSAAGALTLWRKAGLRPRRRTDPLSRAEAEERDPVPGVSANHLRRMLRGDFPRLLPEWLVAVDRAGLRLPFEQLPAVFELARPSRDLRPLVAAVAGRRGAWLAAQNPDWNFAVVETDDLWETGTRDQRVKFLASLRSRDPAAVRERLQITWKTDPADARAAFLGLFEQGLSPADEPFLEAALDDRSKEVRRVAADLLARLPESQFVARMIARATPLLTIKTGKLLGKLSLTVNLPAEPDAAATRDGLDPKAHKDEKQFGEKASLLLQILAAVPPAHWSRTFEATPGKLLAAAKKDEFARSIISGWARAAERSRDTAWAEALLEGPLPMDEWIGVGPLFLNVLSTERRGAWLAGQVRSRGLLDSRRAHWNELLAMLHAFESAWPPELSAAVAAALTHMAADGIGWYLRTEAEQLLARVPPKLAAETTAGWPSDKESIAALAEFAAFRLEALTPLHAV